MTTSLARQICSAVFFLQVFVSVTSAPSDIASQNCRWIIFGLSTSAFRSFENYHSLWQGVNSPMELWTNLSYNSSSFQNRFSKNCINVLVDSSEFQQEPEDLQSRLNFLPYLTNVYFGCVKRLASHESCFESPILTSPSSCTSPVSSSFKQLLHGKTLHITLQQLSYFVVIADGRPIGGPAKDFVDHVSQVYNFSTIIEVSRKPLAAKPINGTWQGLLGDLSQGKTEALVFVAPTLARNLAFDTTTPAFPGYVKFFVAHRQAAVDWKALVYPLSLGVWILVALTAILCIPLLYLEFWSLYRSSSESLYQAIATVLSALTQESFPLHKRGRFVSLLLIFFALVISTAYSSNLISFLTLPEKEDDIKTFYQLANSETGKKYDVTMLHIVGGLAVTFINTSSVAYVKRIRERRILDRNFTKCLERAIFSATSACIGWDFVVENIVANKFSMKGGLQPFVPSQEALLVSAGSVFLPKRSTYFQFWNSVVGRARDAGLFHKWTDRALKLIRKMPQSDVAQKLQNIANKLSVRSTQSLSLENFVLCFGLVIACWLVAFLSFFVEFTCLLFSCRQFCSVIRS